MRVVSLHIFEGDVARLAVVGRFLVVVRFLFDFDRGHGRGLLLVRLVGGVHEPRVAHHVPAVSGRVRAAGAAVHALTGGRWARRRRLPALVFQDARYVALFL